MVFDELHINSLAVDPAWRRRGLARRLLATRPARCRRRPARESRRSKSASRTSAARALYEGLGFRVEGVRRDYYQEPREDALILWNRHLADGSGRVTLNVFDCDRAGYGTGYAIPQKEAEHG